MNEKGRSSFGFFTEASIWPLAENRLASEFSFVLGGVRVHAVLNRGHRESAQNKYGQYAPFGRRTALPGGRCRRRYCAAFANIIGA
jgi:hypothetical protein